MLECKKISPDSFKNKITEELFTNISYMYIYIHLEVC